MSLAVKPNNLAASSADVPPAVNSLYFAILPRRVSNLFKILGANLAAARC
jgi:hypothetical protein